MLGAANNTSVTVVFDSATVRSPGVPAATRMPQRSRVMITDKVEDLAKITKGAAINKFIHQSQTHPERSKINRGINIIMTHL